MPASSPIADESAWMSAALEQAYRARDAGEVPVGAVMVLEGAIIGAGHNTTEEADDPAGHAEINALRAAGAALGDWRLESSTLIVTLEPCAMCMGAIALARVRRVIYGARDPRLGACGSALDLRVSAIAPHLLSVEGGLMEAECSALMKEFFKALR
jgi:tRNA(adenine34) deaminase